MTKTFLRVRLVVAKGAKGNPFKYSDFTPEQLAALTGPIGPAGTVNVGTVTTVAPDQPAEVIPSGTPENRVLSFKIPQGVHGEDGDDGAAATITVLGTETLAAGEDAEVVEGGTPQARTLQFNIPRGPKGDPGDAVVGASVIIDCYDNTAAGTHARVVTTDYSFDGYPDLVGKTLRVHCKNGLSTTSDPTLNLNSKGARAILSESPTNATSFVAVSSGIGPYQLNAGSFYDVYVSAATSTAATLVIRGYSPKQATGSGSRAGIVFLSAEYNAAAPPNYTALSAQGAKDLYAAVMNKPLPTPAQIGAIPTTEKDVANGVAGLNASGLIDLARLPATLVTLSGIQTALSALAAQQTAILAVAAMNTKLAFLTTNQATRTTMASMPVTGDSVLVNATAATAWSWSGTMQAGQRMQILLRNTHASANFNQVIPNAGVWDTNNPTPVTVKAGSYIELNVWYINSIYYVIVREP